MIHEYIIKVDDTKADIMGGIPLEEPPKELVRCPECVYKKNCISTENGVEPDGFCKWGETVTNIYG